MRSYTFVRFLFGLILIVGLIGIGVVIYNAGVSQGLASSGAVPAPGSEGAIRPYYYGPFYRPWGFWPFGLFFPLLFVFLFFLVIRCLFFRGWHHRGPRYWRGWGGQGRQDIPPMVEEWHRKMHAGEEQQDSAQE